MSYEDYKKQLSADISEQIGKLCCQPVLFVGSGLSLRYFGAPNWVGLLKELAANCPLIDKDYAYYAQSCSSAPQIGSIFADKYREWAWGTGKNQFPKELFEPDVAPDAFFKHAAAELIEAKSPKDLVAINAAWTGEVSALQAIKPHAVLTTNYDTFLEKVFPDHAKIVGQSALKGIPFTVGEIFKIHGCVNDIEQMVLTSEDYDTFHKKKKFIAARLLSLFNEHPMLIVGYAASDPNVQAILSDIDEALALPGSLIENIYFVEYDPSAESKTSLPTEKLIQIEENRSVRVKLIVTSDFEWVFKAFKSPDNLNSIPPSFMRAILARSYELVRTDIPRTELNVDFDFLERKLENRDEFAKLFGITTISNPSAISAKFPYSITELGKKLGGKGWHLADKLIKVIIKDTGVDLKAEDSKFHHAMKVNHTEFHKYSDDAFDLLKKVKAAGHCAPEWLK
ncbi:SIR2 family protein [Rhodobacteraceae bacterium R_SAG4]|nr:SIR2 family protein [Rhodobacteraceae bacterium R_SAG4]